MGSTPAKSLDRCDQPICENGATVGAEVKVKARRWRSRNFNFDFRRGDSV